MKIEVKKNVDPDKWDKLVCSFSGNIKHCYVWALYQKALDKGYPIYIHAYDNNICIGVSLAFINKSKHWPLSSFTKVIQIDSFPLVKDNNEKLLSSMIKEIEKYSKKSGTTMLNIDSSNPSTSYKGLKKMGYIINHRIELTIDLLQSEDEIFKNFKGNLRRRIKKAENYSIKIFNGQSEDDMLVLREMQILSSQRQSKRGSHFQVSDENLYQCIKKYLIDNNALELFIAKKGEENLSAYLCECFNKKHTLMYGGSSINGKGLFAPSFLIWEAIKHYKKNGFKKFTLGGVPAHARFHTHNQYGLYKYKKSYGAKEEDRYGGYKVLNKSKYIIYKYWMKLKGY